MTRFFSGFIYANLWIALLSTLFTAEYYLLQENPIQSTVLTLVFFSTLFVYIVLRLKKATPALDNLHLQWIKKNSDVLIVVAILSVILIFISYVQLTNVISQVVLVVLGGISVWYGIPFFKKTPELRLLPFVKVFLIGIVYACVAVVIPYLESSEYVFTLAHGLFFIAQLFYIVAITIPFDIRDDLLDKEAGIKTLATHFTEKSAQIIAIICLTVATAILAVLVVGSWLSIAFLLGMYTYTIFAILKTSSQNTFIRTALLVEGSMVIHFLVFLFYSS